MLNNNGDSQLPCLVPDFGENALTIRKNILAIKIPLNNKLYSVIKFPKFI